MKLKVTVKFTIKTALLFVLIHLTNYINAQKKDSIPLLEEIKVSTGQFFKQTLKSSVFNVKVIGNREIQARNATNILELLNNQLGFRLSPDQTLGETDITMMGMSGQNVKILLDGVPLIDRNATKQSISQIDINRIDHIEYINGPLSVSYGTDAQAGVINIITKRMSDGNLDITIKSQEESAGKEYNFIKDKGLHNENISINYTKNNWNISGYGTRNNFGGWQGSAIGREKEFKPKDQWLTGGTIGYNSKNISFNYRLDYLHENLYIPGEFINNLAMYGYIDANYIVDRYTHILQNSIHVNDKIEINNSLSYQNYTRTTKTIGRDLLKDSSWLSTADAAQDISKFNSKFLRSTLQYKIVSNLSMQSGIEIRMDNASGARIEGTPSIKDYALFTSFEWFPIQKLNIRPGVRLEKNSQYDAPPAIPSLNVKYALSDNLDIRASYGKGFRAPALRELYFYFFDSNHSIEGNPDLKAESSNSYNLSLNYQSKIHKNWNYTTSINGFYSNFKNQINLVLSPNNENIYTYFNIDKFKTTGISIDNKISSERILASVGFLYIGRYNQIKDQVATKEPTFTWSPEVNANIMYSFPKPKLQLSLFYKYTGKLPVYQLSGTEPYLAKTQDYSWMDFTIGKQIINSLTFNLGVKNIFNVTSIQNTVGGTTAHSTASAISYSYGRSYFFSIIYNFKKNQNEKK